MDYEITLWRVLPGGRLVCHRCGAVADSPEYFYRGHIAARKPGCLRPWTVGEVSSAYGVEPLRYAWEDLLRLDGPKPRRRYGERDDKVHPSRVDRRRRHAWLEHARRDDASTGSPVDDGYYLGKIAEGLLDQGNADDWVLDDDVAQQHGAESRNVLAFDLGEATADGEVVHALWGSEAAWGGESAATVEELTSEGGLTRRESQVAAWIAEGNSLGGEYAPSLAEALGTTQAAARMTLSRLRAKLAGHWAVSRDWVPALDDVVHPVATREGRGHPGGTWSTDDGDSGFIRGRNSARGYPLHR